jgi:anti-sigma-K factor RskA
MSGHLPDDPEEREALAGEYVLGTLDAATARRVAAALAQDPALARAVAEWEARLAPLAELAPPEAPPPGLWERIAARLPAAEAARAVARPGLARRLWEHLHLWRGLAFAAAAAAVAAFILRPDLAPPAQYMTVMVSDRSQAAWLAQVDRSGALQLAAVNPVGAEPAAVPADRVMQLWALPPGATAPTSLGLLPREGGRVSIAQPAVRPVPGMLIEISLEPAGGSPTGRPTGPILFIGRLSEAGPRT